jgi:predicted metal-dependent phosphoesterase TrpH
MSDATSTERYVDLHLHTTWSDGRWEPRRVVEEAAAHGLAAIAVTDHDVVGGLADARQAAAEHSFAFVAGVELTAGWDGRTVHMLGYAIEPTAPPLVDGLERGRVLMAEHVATVLEALEQAGTPLSADDLTRYRARYPSGATLVMAMVQRGILRKASDGAALLRLASREPRAYSAAEAIGLIHAAGGIAALAHPVKIQRDRPCLGADDLAPLVEAGLDAIEVWQIVHGPAEREHYAEVARSLGLLMTGGSDCHGPRRDAGPRLGSQRVPFAVYEGIAEAVAVRRTNASR